MFIATSSWVELSCVAIHALKTTVGFVTFAYKFDFAVCHFEFRKMSSIYPDWVKKFALNLLGRCIMATWPCGSDYMTKYRNRKLICVTSSNERQEQNDVDVRDYNVIRDIWTKLGINLNHKTTRLSFIQSTFSLVGPIFYCKFAFSLYFKQQIECYNMRHSKCTKQANSVARHDYSCPTRYNKCRSAVTD